MVILMLSALEAPAAELARGEIWQPLMIIRTGSVEADVFAVCCTRRGPAEDSKPTHADESTATLQELEGRWKTRACPSGLTPQHVRTATSPQCVRDGWAMLARGGVHGLLMRNDPALASATQIRPRRRPH